MGEVLLLRLFTSSLILLGAFVNSVKSDVPAVLIHDTNTNNSYDDQNSTIHSMENVTEPWFDEEVSLTLKKCSTSKLNIGDGDSIRLPTFLLFTSLEFYYIFGNHSLENTTFACPNGDHFETTTTSFTEFIKIENKVNNLVARKSIVILSNGHLSVGNSSDNSITFYSPDEYCLEAISGQNENTVAKLKVCLPSKSRQVLNKCCAVGAILDDVSMFCIAMRDFKWDPRYINHTSLELLPIQNWNPVYRSPKLDCGAHREDWVEDGCHTEFYPVTNGKLAFIGRYRYEWEYMTFASNSTHCFDAVYMEDGSIKNILILCEGNETPSDNEERNDLSRIYMVCMYIGSFFHLLTTIFYLITWPKHNIHGKTLCSCTLALFFMTLLMGTAHLLGILGNTNTKGFCFFNGVAAQYFFISSFTWLVVVNVDLWRTFRSIRPHGGKGLRRFILYSLGGWGFPFLVTGISLTLNSIYTCRTSRVPTPDYGENICFVAPWAQGYYIYYILSILIAIAFLFGILTLVGLYSFKKGTNNLRSNKRDEDKQTVLLFLKLSVVMGLSWIFEVISWVDTNESSGYYAVWMIFDVYNALSAILIFIIFVCKRTNLNLLEQTHPIFKVCTSAINEFTSKFIGENSSVMTINTGVEGPRKLSTRRKSFDTVTYTKNKNDEEQINGGFE
ncbi:unnamed protein product [Orchesella dallaii]|uniref:G-protein coupled receptors family 2 profile 2 domain-containing protein n=1 Tax=Orchesella dallaii TaxID=48710 RepID=A0ABP1Q9M9_9HEXA